MERSTTMLTTWRPSHKARHIEGISIRNLSLVPEHKGTLRDGYIKPSSPLSPLRYSGPKQELERSQSAVDLKSVANDTGKQAESNGSPKRPTPRLRRRSTLSWLNESGSARQVRLLDVVTKRIPASFFSIHPPYQGDELGESRKDQTGLYISETVRQSMNPDFKFVDPARLHGSRLGSLESFLLRVWTQSSENRERDGYFLLLEMEVNLPALTWIGQSLDHYPRPFPPNTVIFKLRDGFYANDAELPADMLGERPRLSRSSTAIPATTSSFHELMKLNNVNECIYDALRTQANVMRDIERILASEQEHTTEILTAKNAPLTTREPLDAVNETRRQIKKLKTSISSARSSLETRRAAIESGTRSIHSSQASLNADDESIRTLEAEHTATKPVLKSQIRRIASTFLDILPIQPIPGAPLHFTIAGLYLPSAAAFSRSTSPSNLSASNIPPMDEDATAAALGHAVLIINCLATYLCIPLPFELFPQGSTSAVFDPLTSAAQLGIPETSRPTSPNPSASAADHERLVMNPPTPTTAPSRLFALTQHGTPVARFAWAVYLVNKDLEELMGAVGLKVVDPRATVANLKYLLEVLAVEKAGVGLGKREGGVVRGLKGRA